MTYSPSCNQRNVNDNSDLTKYQVPNLCIGTLDFTSPDFQKDSAYAESLMAEQIQISGTPLNVFKMLGLQQQGDLIDLIGSGYPLCSGTPSGYNILDIFVDNMIPWQSIQTGDQVPGIAYVGYNFGTKKNIIGEESYDPSKPVTYQITTIRLQQGTDPTTRITQARIERSDDGINWTRVDIVNLPDNDLLNMIPVRQSVPAQQWRIVPLMFNGYLTNSPWVIQRLELMDYLATTLDTIQDLFLLENRDRSYAQSSICLKADYQIPDIQMDLSKFGLDIPSQYVFTVSFAKMVGALGRPLVVGDILELPSEMQYYFNLNPVRKYLEVSDVGWSPEGFTPNWRPVLYRFYANPALSTQETKEIFGTPETRFNIDDDDFLKGLEQVQSKQFESSEFIERTAEDAVPETGIDVRDIKPYPEDAVRPGGFNPRGLYVENGLPPDGSPYTEGESMPKSPSDGDWHRLTYPVAMKLPARLYQYNGVKTRWIYKETDTRGLYSSHKPSMLKMFDSATSRDLNSNQVI